MAYHNNVMEKILREIKAQNVRVLDTVKNVEKGKKY
jgi:hypothetical protein